VRPFEIRDAGLVNAPGVALSGEIDINVTERLEAALTKAIISSTGAFVIDLTDVTFLDSSGLAALTRAQALLGREDRALALICPAGRAQRVLELTGLNDLFVIYDSREQAAAALVPAD
jgi:anti-sigma B factor antagonist